MNNIRWIALIVYMLLPLSVHAMDFGEFLAETMDRFTQGLWSIATKNNKLNLCLSCTPQSEMLAKLDFYSKEIEKIFKNIVQITPKTVEAFHTACRYGTATMIPTFLDAGFQVDQIDAHGFTPLMTALEAGNNDIVQILLFRGATLNVTSLQSLLSLTEQTKMQGLFPNSKYYPLNLIATVRYSHCNPFDECKETIKNTVINYTHIAREKYLSR